MLKSRVFALCLLSVVGVAHATGPTEQQVKRALYDRYVSGVQGAAELQKALDDEVVVGACEPIGDQYRCPIDNTLLNTSISMIFARDAATDTWKYVRDDIP